MRSGNQSHPEGHPSEKFHYSWGLMRKKSLKRSGKLNPISKSPHRRAKRFVPKAIIEQVMFRSGGQCEFVDENGYRCCNPAQRQPHHVLKRSQGGPHTVENLRATCPWHNHYAEIEKRKCQNLRPPWVIPFKGWKPEGSKL